MSNNATTVPATTTTAELGLTNDAVRPSYCSFKADTKEAKVKLYKAMTQADKRLSDCINSTILVKDVFFEEASIVNTETGEVTKTPRIVLFDKDGTSFACVSFGIMNALKRMFAVFGEPTWDEPIAVKVIQINNKDRKMLSLDVVL